MDARALLEITVPLFLIMDPIGNVPICLSLLRNFPPRRQQRILLRELLFALGIAVLFCFLGDWLLQFLGLGASTLRLAGGVVLFIISMKMVFPDDSPDKVEHLEGDPFFVPIAVPLLAGPSLLAAVMLYATLDPAPGGLAHATRASGPLATALALVLAWLPTAGILLGAPWLSRVLGRRGLRAAERLMGLILVLLSIQMMEDGVRLFLKSM